MDGYIEDFFLDIERIISGYDAENKVYSHYSVSIENNPKILTLCSASVFEKTIKDRIRLFLAHPASPISTAFPCIANINPRKTGKPTEDTIFGGFVAGNDKTTGAERKDASKFYNYFGGESFKTSIKSKFDTLRIKQEKRTDEQTKRMEGLVNSGLKQYEDSYAILLEKNEQLSRYSFDRAEQAYLNIKLRRNRVAHNYMIEFLDSFNDMRLFYYGAALYIAAVNDALLDLVDSVSRQALS